jgi:hypothetical protein
MSLINGHDCDQIALPTHKQLGSVGISSNQLEKKHYRRQEKSSGGKPEPQ